MIKQRRSYADYLNVGSSVAEFVLMNAGFTELNESPAAQTSSKKYIGNKSASKAIIGYDWSAPFNTDMIRAEKAVDYICNIGELQLVGADAETDYIKVDLDKPGTSENTFKARKFRVAIELSNFVSNDGEMAATGNLLGVGDLVVGTFNTTTKEFTEGFTGKTLECTYSSTGSVTEISVSGVTYDKSTSKFKNIPYNTKSFTFKDGVANKTATLNSTWSVA